nr:prenyltransferase/squalene oxidase repeat-containing protein [Micromonospora sp. DR5-3]
MIASMMRQPAGQVSPSLYETARLVSLAPWLAGHAERVHYLLRSQRPDGGWGPPEGYALVPTLSATEALLTVRHTFPQTDAVLQAVDRGLRALTRWLEAGQRIPDTPAVDLIVPALTATINEHLSRPDAGLPHRAHLDLPTDIDDGRLAAVRALVAAGKPVPEKLLHALEVIGPMARQVPGVQPLPPGLIGASPAATAAWLDPEAEDDHHDSRHYLESIVDPRSGSVPCAIPITVFERAWVVGTLTRAGIAVPASPDLVGSLTADLTAAGTPAGPGLPADADTTSVTLYALAQLGVPTNLECLWRYETPDGFCTWPGEDGFSLTTNAHVLDALGQHLRSRPGAPARYREAARRVAAALRERQEPDGSWRDRWHASPYYATVSCALALSESGPPNTAAEALSRAVDWVLATQRPDGSWGRWEGTAEETAYAVQLLVAVGRQRPGATDAIRSGYAFLTAHGHRKGPALWHDKDLYRPMLIVRAAVLAARQLARTTVDVDPTRRSAYA